MNFIRRIMEAMFVWDSEIPDKLNTEDNIKSVSLNPYTLSFRGPLEKEFIKQDLTDSLLQINIALTLGALFYSSFFLLDWYLVPEHILHFVAVRIGLVWTAILSVILIINKTKRTNLFQPLVALSPVFVATTLLYFQIIVAPVLDSSYYIGIIVIYFWSYSFLRLRYLWATFVGLSIFVFYMLSAVYALNLEIKPLIISASFLLASNFVGIIIAYVLEYYTRRNFFQNLVLKNSLEANISLNKKISDSHWTIIKAEEKLLLQSKALESAANSILILDMEGTILWCNSAFLDMSGYNSDDVVGHNPRILKSGKHDKTFYKNIWVTVLKGSVWSGEIINKKKNGDLYYEEMIITPVMDKELNKITHFIAIKQDITLRKDIEDELFESEKRLRGLFENASMGIYRSTLSGKVLMANNALLKMFGYRSEEEFKEQNLSSTCYKDPGQRDKFIKEISEKGSLIGFVSEWKKKDGTIIFIRESARTDFDENGEMVFEGTIEDITLSIKAQAELQNSSDRLQTVFDNLSGAIIIHDINGKITSVNNKVLDFFNISMDEALSTNVKDLVIKYQPLNFLEERWQKVLNNNRTFKFEAKAKRPNESSFFDVNIFLSKIELGNDSFILANLRDITEQKSSEQALRMTKHTVDKSAVSIFWHTKDAKFIYANELACNKLGYTLEELLSLEISDIDPLWDKESWEKDGFVTLQNKKIRKFETIFKTNGGKEFPVEIVSNLSNFEGEEVFVVYATDITEQKEANRKLLLTQNSVDLNITPIFWTGLNGKIIYANEAAAQSVQYTNEELLSKTIYEINPYETPEKINAFREFLRQHGFKRHEQIHRRKDGTEFPVEISASILTHDSVEIVVSFMQDITERNKAAEELILAKEKAEQSDKLKSEFLAGMSHEIRTPVNTILNFISLIRADLGDKTTDDINESFEMIDNGSRRLIRTIDSIINMSQLQAGSYDVKQELFSIADDVLASLFMEFKPIADQNILEFEFLNNCDDSTIIGDLYTITQLFINLIDNAIKYTIEGKVSVGVSSTETQIIINVSDTGVGMSEEFLPLLFNPFVQEEMGYTRSFEGNGLGLALVSKYLELNNATIKVKSKKSEGTTFSVFIPKPTTKQIEQHSAF